MSTLPRALFWGNRGSSSSGATRRMGSSSILVSTSARAFSPRARRGGYCIRACNAPASSSSSSRCTPRRTSRRGLPPAAALAAPAPAAAAATTTAERKDAADRRWMAVALEQARLAGERGEVPIGAVVVVAHDDDDDYDETAAATTPTKQTKTTTATPATGAARPLGAPCGNEAEALCDPTAHAEMLALRSALQQLSIEGRSWRSVLPRATLYATCEPCPMCAGGLLACRVGRVVYGARQPRIGADGSWASLLRGGGGGGGGGGGDGGVGGVEAPAAASSSLWGASSSGEMMGAGEGQEEREEAAGAGAGAAATAAAPQQPQQLPHPYHPNLQVRSGVRADEAAALLREFFRRRRRERRQEEEEEEGDEGDDEALNL